MNGNFEVSFGGIASRLRKAAQQSQLRVSSALMVGAVLFAVVPSARCSNVSVQTPPGPPIRLQQRARIALLFDGIPLPLAQFSLRGRDRTVNLASDKDGIAVLPELSPGRYFIGSLPVWNRNAGEVGVCIIPCPDEGLETVDFVTDSLNGPLRPIDRDESALKEIWMDVGAMGKRGWLSMVRAAEQVPNTESLPNFRGVVQDRTGAVIPHAWIDVLVEGTEGEKHAALVRSDDAGAFSADLPDGDYIAVVSSPGFRVGTYRFCITAAGSSAALHVVLDVGAETEAVTIAISSHRGLPIP